MRTLWPQRRPTPEQEAAVARGWELLDAGDPEAALDAFAQGRPHAEAPLGRAAALLDLGDDLGAYQAARKIAVDRIPPARRQLARRIRAAALLETGRREQALEAVDTALHANREDLEAVRMRAEVLFRLGRLLEAAEAAHRAAEAIGDASAWSLLGRIQVFNEQPAEAAFARAADLDPEHFPRPHRVSRAAFERLADQALAEIPPAFHRYLANTLVVVEDHPTLEAVRMGTDPGLLGVYEGGTALESGMPEHIVLYQQSHENLCGTAEALRAEVRETILHEVGHHFGMEESEMPF
jgi:predicted Zn-dependent protease with MMP-like domain